MKTLFIPYTKKRTILKSFIIVSIINVHPFCKERIHAREHSKEPSQVLF